MSGYVTKKLQGVHKSDQDEGAQENSEKSQSRSPGEMQFDTRKDLGNVSQSFLSRDVRMTSVFKTLSHRGHTHHSQVAESTNKTGHHNVQEWGGCCVNAPTKEKTKKKPLSELFLNGCSTGHREEWQKERQKAPRRGAH